MRCFLRTCAHKTQESGARFQNAMNEALIAVTSDELRDVNMEK